MKSYLKYISVTLLLAFSIVNAPVIGRAICLFSNPAKDVYLILMKSLKKHPHKKTLLLGDSVCRQVFGKADSEDTLNMCENQAYEIPGNYLLLRNLIEHQNEFDTVTLYFNPFSLKCSLDQIFTYNYFVKPFRPYLSRLDPQEIDYVGQTYPPKSIFSFLPSVRYAFSDWKMNAAPSPDALSEVSARYLDKIENICQATDMKFLLKSLPVRISRKNEIAAMVENSSSILNQSAILRQYFNNITYLPDSLFLDDVHYKDPEEIRDLITP
ncbi:MAG: hypothetical protein KDC53_00495 [Saprospiraceae bacterium]|nr:hypothetical protein [Saprospiraceae bacterium]